VQEAYLRAFRFFDGLRGTDARPWLLGIVRNACYDWMRRNAAIADTLVFDELRDSDAAEPASVGIDPAHLWEQRALRGRVNAAIEALAPPFREVIVLRELEEMSYEQIAAVAGIPVGTVMSRLSRARAALRVALQDVSAGQPAAAPERKTRS
jgi:RNA polymerase sigma-70 factor (ECF subfamily)